MTFALNAPAPAPVNFNATPGLPAPILTLREARQQAERDLLLRAFDQTTNLTTVARWLKVTRPTLYSLMHKLGIQPPKGKATP